jgi:hypothetical protein
MIRKCLVLVAISLFLGSLAFAEPQRAFFVKENRMPGPFKAEVGVIGQYVTVPDDYAATGNGWDVYRAAPYVRYGLAENLAVYGEVPYVQIKPSRGDTEEGLGDVVAGAELVAFQDLFGYPFIIPHVEASFNTGDEDKGLGNGKTLFTAGVSVGTVVMDMFHYVLDARYTFNDKTNDGSGEEKNIATFAGAFIWDLSDKFSLIAEAKCSNNKDAEGDIPMYFQGGFAFQATENVYINILGGSAKNTDEETIVSGKLAYTF